MTIKLRNQKPAVLYPTAFNRLPLIKPTKPVDEYVDAIETHLRDNYVEPLFIPVNPAHAARIESTENGQTTDIDADMLHQSILHLWGSPTLDVQLQDQLGEIYRQAIQYHAPNDWLFEEQLGVEALTRLKFPLPSSKTGRVVKYSASVDIIPAAKGFLGTPDDMNAMSWFANLTGYLHERQHNNFLLVTVQSADVWNDLLANLQSFVTVWSAKTPLNKDTNKLLSDLQNINMTNELSAGLFLPNGGGTNAAERDPLSFSRILTYVLAHCEQNFPQGAVTSQPLNLFQMYLPENIIVLNLENYAHATPASIKRDWDDIDKALTAKKNLNFISNKKLMTIKRITTSMGSAQMSSSVMSAGKPAERLAKVKFSGKPIPAANMIARMAKVIMSQITSKQTQNTYKTVKNTFMRPNRRQPDNIDLQGKLITTAYRPDIHIYLDTSGSISESNYRDAIMNLIRLTQKIECNLYFTSFSHVISQTAALKTKGVSAKTAYEEFMNVPKVGGGTDFEQVWRKIDILDDANTKSGRSHQINFIITDFGYSLSNGHKWELEQASLRHTYYVPISVDAHTWQYVLNYATKFRKQMVKAGDHNIRRRMLL